MVSAHSTEALSSDFDLRSCRISRGGPSAPGRRFDPLGGLRDGSPWIWIAVAPLPAPTRMAQRAGKSGHRREPPPWHGDHCAFTWLGANNEPVAFGKRYRGVLITRTGPRSAVRADAPRQDRHGPPDAVPDLNEMPVALRKQLVRKKSVFADLKLVPVYLDGQCAVRTHHAHSRRRALQPRPASTEPKAALADELDVRFNREPLQARRGRRLAHGPDAGEQAPSNGERAVASGVNLLSANRLQMLCDVIGNLLHAQHRALDVGPQRSIGDESRVLRRGRKRHGGTASKLERESSARLTGSHTQALGEERSIIRTQGNRLVPPLIARLEDVVAISHRLGESSGPARKHVKFRLASS